MDNNKYCLKPKCTVLNEDIIEELSSISNKKINIGLDFCKFIIEESCKKEITVLPEQSCKKEITVLPEQSFDSNSDATNPHCDKPRKT